jgi:hypothetical protein|tara:strand:- start:147 stop:320 length:174 start_codon:yes stop_codon:yes gene_type:complete
MTSKEFKIWLKTFLDSSGIGEIKIRDGYDTTYNHLTILKTIQNKLEEVNDEKIQNDE